MYRRGSYILGRILGFVVVAIVACLVAVQTPKVQTKLTLMALDKVTAALDGRIEYSELKVLPSGVLVLRDALLLDEAPWTEGLDSLGMRPVDSIFYAKSITATFSLAGLLGGEGLHLNRVTVSDAGMFLTIEPNEWGTNLTRVFRMKSSHERPEPGPDVFDIRRFTIKNFRYRMVMFTDGIQPTMEGVVNYSDMDATANLRGHGMRYSGSKMYAVADDGSITEKSGYKATNLRGRVEVGQGKTLIENLRLDDNWSELRAKSFSMTYEKPFTDCDFLTDVIYAMEFRPTTLGIRTVNAFAYGALDGISSVLEISGGSFRGYVNDFKVKGLSFREQLSGVSGSVDGSVIGLPEMEKTLVDANVTDLSFNTGSTEKLLAGFGMERKLEHIAPAVQFRVNLAAKGPLNRLTISADAAADDGWLQLDGDLRNLVNPHRDMEISARLQTHSFDISKVYAGLPVGECDLYAAASGMVGREPRLRLDTLGISRLQFGSLSDPEAPLEEYRGINASGFYTKTAAAVNLYSPDPKLQLRLEALAEMPEDGTQVSYSVEGEVDCIDLEKLGIDTRDGGAKLSISNISANLGVRGNLIEGDTWISEVTMHNGHGTTDLGDLAFDAWVSDGTQYFSLESGFANVNLHGSGTIVDFISDIQDITLHRYLPALASPGSASDLDSRRYKLDVQFHDSRDLLSYLAPGVYIADSTRLALSIADGGRMNGRLFSSRLAYGTTYMRDVDLRFDNWNDAFNAVLHGSNARAGGVEFSAPGLNAIAAGDSLRLVLGVDSFAEGGSESELNVEAKFSRDSLGRLNIAANPENSYIGTKSSRWQFSNSAIAYNGAELLLHDFMLHNGGQYISAEGAWSGQVRDTMRLHVHDVDLALVNEFMKHDFGVAGIADGTVYLLSDPGLRPAMFIDFRADSLHVGGEDAGNLRLMSMLGEQRNDLRLFVNHRIEDRNSLRATGHYYLDDGHSDLTAELDDFPLKVLSPFFASLFDGMDGGVSGKLMLQGSGGKFESSSEDLFIDDAQMRLALTGVNYTIRGPLSMDNNGLYFNGVNVSDGDNGYASINGALQYDRLSDFNLNLRASLNNLKVLDSGRQGNPGFYGQLRSSGNATITGPFNALNINAIVNTSGPGNIYVPATASSAGSTGLLTFTEPARPVDPYEQMLAGLEKSSGGSSSDTNIQVFLNISPAVGAHIELDRNAGTAASFNGSGSATMHIRPFRSIFEIDGDYTVSEGDFKFSVPGILSRDFEIAEGSNVHFSGNFMESQLDVTAYYNLKTSLSTLIADTTSVSSRRSVQCGIHISDRLRNPQIRFSVDVPDLDPTTKSQVESALNTDDKVQKQFMALLVLGSFIPDETSGVVNSSNMLVSNVTELMSSQLSNILQKLDIPLDVGIGYQNTNAGNDIFDVAISTQLFNNRVLVGGSVGNRQFSSSSGSDVVGDLDIQIKLDPDGKFRLNLFSHSADEYTNYLDLSQRNGVGVSYQKEYSGLREFLRSIFVSKKKREAERGASPLKTIIVEHEQRDPVSDSDAPRGERPRRRTDN